jgi:hypothetical protein
MPNVNCTVRRIFVLYPNQYVPGSSTILDMENVEWNARGTVVENPIIGEKS